MTRLLKKVVAEAAAVGELKFRRRLVEGEMRQVRLNLMEDREFSASLKKRASRTTETATQAVRRREYRASLREHNKTLARARYLLQEEWEQLGRLTSEIEAQLAETIRSARKHAHNAARPLPRPNPLRSSVSVGAGSSVASLFPGLPSSPYRSVIHKRASNQRATRTLYTTHGLIPQPPSYLDRLIRRNSSLQAIDSDTLTRDPCC